MYSRSNFDGAFTSKTDIPNEKSNERWSLHLVRIIITKKLILM